jgi:RNA methyltransferase, TrmH family
MSDLESESTGADTEIIDSLKHPDIALARTLSTRASRDREARGLADGLRLVTQILQGNGPVDVVLIPAGAHDDELLATADAAGVPVREVKAGVLRHALGISTTPDALAICRLPSIEASTLPAGSLAVVCDRVLDPGNLGSIIRTAVALDAPGVVLTGDEDPGARRVIDASRGAVLHAGLHRWPDPKSAVKALQADGWWVVAADGSSGGDLEQSSGDHDRLALVVGNETDGVSQTVLRAVDERGAIPIRGPVESLNVAVAAGIGLWILGHRLGGRIR